MRWSVKLFAAAVMCALAIANVPAFQNTDPLKAIVGSYLEIQAQLAADKMDGVKPAAAAIATNAASLGQDRGGRIAQTAKAVGDAADLKTAREAFGPLSDSVIAAAQADGKNLAGVKLGFCPMVKRSWLQKDAKIRNPYYGSSMLECGELKDLKK
jgi:Protein of unknown function (DUF3347)